MLVWRTLLALFFALGVLGAAASQLIKEEPKLARFFEARGVEGCFVVYDPVGPSLHVYNPERAGTRYRPASTFKIANALIGLELGAVRDVEEVVPYGGTEEYFDSWEKDMNLRDAMKASNVAVFHQLAKRIGLERMSDAVESFEYGNQKIGDDIESRFWLKGPLAISAFEQVDFLRRLNAHQLSVSQDSVQAVREILEYERAADYTIYGKTGWAGPEEPQTGWWVGWIERGDLCYPFALNIDVISSDDAKHRIPVALDCLGSLGLLP